MRSGNRTAVFRSAIHSPMVALLIVGVAFLLAGCSGGSSNQSPTEPPTSQGVPPSGSSSTPSPMSSAEAAAQIKSNWEAFFSGSTSASAKANLVQNGGAFVPVIQAQANLPLAKSASAKVLSVDVISSTSATVTYTIFLSGKPALSDVMGHAVFEDGRWKVSDLSFCGLLFLEGTKPAVCSSVGAGSSPSPTS